MTTAGGLVFIGGTSDRYFRAFDAHSGRLLWQYRTNSGITGVPTSFEVDGVQYIAVQSGWGVDAQGMLGRIDAHRGTETIVPQGGVVWVFALER
jgi:alcohol dehydrogenase (cytochrome c)